MTNQPAGPSSSSAPTALTQEQTQAATTKQKLLGDIRVKWGKFSEQELKDLKNNDDLVTQLVAKYALEKGDAQRQADTLRAGRDI